MISPEEMSSSYSSTSPVRVFRQFSTANDWNSYRKVLNSCNTCWMWLEEDCFKKRLESRLKRLLNQSCWVNIKSRLSQNRVKIELTWARVWAGARVGSKSARVGLSEAMSSLCRLKSAARLSQLRVGSDWADDLVSGSTKPISAREQFGLIWNWSRQRATAKTTWRRWGRRRWWRKRRQQVGSAMCIEE